MHPAAVHPLQPRTMAQAFGLNGPDARRPGIMARSKHVFACPTGARIPPFSAAAQRKKTIRRKDAPPFWGRRPVLIDPARIRCGGRLVPGDSVTVLLPRFVRPLSAVRACQPEEYPPNLSIILLLVTLTAVTRVARRFLSSGCAASPLSMVYPFIKIPAYGAAASATAADKPAADWSGPDQKAGTRHARSAGC